MEVSKDFAQDSVQWCFAEQTIENPAIVLAVKIIEALVNRTHEETHEETQQLVNTHVQHVVNTVEVEEPKLIKETVQRKKPIVQEKINQVTKDIDVPQVQFLDKADDMPVVVQRQGYMTPEIQTVQGAQTSENLGTVFARQLALAETVEVVEIGDAVEAAQVQDIDKIMDVISYSDAETSSHRTDFFERSEWSVRRETHERDSGDKWKWTGLSGLRDTESMDKETT